MGPAPQRDADAVSKGYLTQVVADLPRGPAGGLIPTTVKTGDYTAAVGELVLAAPATTALTVTLPAAATAAAGTVIGVKRTTGGDQPVIITGDIDGDTSVRLAGPNSAVRLVADTSGRWRIESTAVFDQHPAETGGSRKVTAARPLGAQPGKQAGFTWYAVPAICERGLASLIEITATGTGTLDLEVRGAPGTGSLWLQAVGAPGTYRNPTCWYLENDTAGDDTLHVGIRNTGADPRTFTLAGLRVERFA